MPEFNEKSRGKEKCRKNKYFDKAEQGKVSPDRVVEAFLILNGKRYISHKCRKKTKLKTSSIFKCFNTAFIFFSSWRRKSSIKQKKFQQKAKSNNRKN